jgi:hypothetical protein
VLDGVPSGSFTPSAESTRSSYRSNGRSVTSAAERTPGKVDARVKRARWKLRTLVAVL